MAKISGHGGFLALDGSPDKRVDNVSYESDIDEIIDDVTDSGSGGAAEGLPIIYKINSLVIEVVDSDHANFAIAIGITEGAVVTLTAKRGAAAEYDKFANTIVRNVHTVNPQNAARRVRITCEYGTLERDAAAPTFA